MFKSHRSKLSRNFGSEGYNKLREIAFELGPIVDHLAHDRHLHSLGFRKDYQLEGRSTHAARHS